MTTLITGAAGFIGSHVASVLGSLGEDTLLVDSFSNYYSPEMKAARVKAMNLDVHPLDLSDLVSLTAFLRDDPTVDSVIHLAAQPGVRVSPATRQRFIMDNLVGFGNVIMACAESGIDRITYASSSSVYGNHAARLFAEDLPDLRPISLYGATKLSNELVAQAACRETGLRMRGLRYFTVYGEWGRPDMAYLKLLTAALHGLEFPVLGSTQSPRDLTYIHDATTATLLCHKDLESRPEAWSDVVNVGGGQPRTLQEIIETIESISGQGIRLSHQERHASDVNRTIASSEYLVSVTGFCPKTPLEKGLQAVAEWIRSCGLERELLHWTESLR